MVKLVVVLYRNRMTLEEQQRWWLEEHAPLGKQIPGLRSYTIDLAGRGEDGSEPEIAGTDYLLFDDWESAQRAFASPEWGRSREHTAASGARVLRTWVAETHHIM